ncbi:MAG: hypothetical protein ACFCVE_09785 [Phycisphaerae bacterium]
MSDDNPHPRVHHVSQWLHNRSLLSIIPLTHHDWLITVAFYTALQAVDALLAHDGIEVSRHDARLSALKNGRRYERVYRSYKPLYDLAYTTRYSAQPGLWVAREDVDAKVLRHLLYPLEQSIRNLLRLDDEVGRERFNPIHLRSST